jgi:hypothetical protein
MKWKQKPILYFLGYLFLEISSMHDQGHCCARIGTMTPLLEHCTTMGSEVIDGTLAQQ